VSCGEDIAPVDQRTSTVVLDIIALLVPEQRHEGELPDLGDFAADDVFKRGPLAALVILTGRFPGS